MDDLAPTPQFEEEIRAAIAAPLANEQFLSSLHTRLVNQAAIQLQDKNKNRFLHSWNNRGEIVNTFRARPILAVIVFLLALFLLTGVAHAVGRLAGFIPGFGFISNIQSVYVLSEPVEVVSGKITLKVDRAVSDENKLWINTTIVGLPEEQHFFQAFLFLSNGEKIPLNMSSGMTIDSDGTHLTFVFPPLPAATSDLVLFVEKLGGQNFNAPIKLRPIKANEVLPAEPEQPTQLRSESHAGVTLVLDHIVQASDKTIFQVSLHFNKPGMSLNNDWNVVLTDQNNAMYPAIDITPDTMGENAKIFQTLPFSRSEQLTVSLNVFPNPKELPVSIDFSTDDAHGFLFDPGPDPAVGQAWTLDEVIHMGDFTLRVIKASLVSATEILFEFEPAKNLTGVMLYTADPLLRGASGGVPLANGGISAEMSFEKIPSQPFEVRVTRVYYTAHGSWEIQWHPSAAPQGAAVQPTVTSVPTQMPYATPTLASTNPILLEVQSLAQQFDAPFQEGPAWIHVVTERTIKTRSGQTFPPPYLISEQWIETDANGYVNRSVWMDKDANGNTIQLAATVGDYSVNFTTGDADFNSSQPYRFSADILTHNLVRAEQNGGSVTREEVPCDDGQPCIVITSIEPFSQPTPLKGETQAMTGLGNKVWINLTTGQQIQYQVFWRLEDGTDRIETTDQYLLVEKISIPPKEILDILSKVKAP